MGTYYRVKATALPDGVEAEAIAERIEAALERVNALMSTYRDDSELSRFNRAAASEAWFDVAPETAQVVRRAIEIADQSGGAFDVTAGPLVNLWSFGPQGGERRIPELAAIDAAMTEVGIDKLEVRLDPPGLRKERDALYVDLSGIAKGYGVDVVGRLLTQAGIDGWFVDIGGEHRARGLKLDESSWSSAIEVPDPSGQRAQRIVELDDAAIATSGDYRNFFEVEGRRFAHVIDPRSGWPTEGSLASVSVIAEDCASADALATAMMVMGADEALQFAEDERLPVLLIERSDATFIERSSTAFDARYGTE